MSPTIQAAIISAVAALTGVALTSATTLFGVVLGAVPTYLIARSRHSMSLKRLYADKWWDKKYEAYVRIDQELTSIFQSQRRWYWEDLLTRHAVPPHEVPDEVLEEIRAEYLQAKEQVERVALTGENLVISDRAVGALRDLLKQLGTPFDPKVHVIKNIDRKLSANKECLRILREEARSDLAGNQEFGTTRAKTT